MVGGKRVTALALIGSQGLLALYFIVFGHIPALLAVSEPGKRRRMQHSREGEMWTDRVLWEHPKAGVTKNPFRESDYEAVSGLLARSAPHAPLFAHNATREWSRADFPAMGGGRVWPSQENTRKSDQEEQLTLLTSGHLLRPTPLCLREGAGYLWSGPPSSGRVVAWHDVWRVLSPKGSLSLTDKVAVRDDTYAFVAAMAAPKAASLFHHVLPLVANLLLLSHVRRAFPGITLTVYLQEWDRGEGGVDGDGGGFAAAQGHAMRALFSAYGDDVTFASSFGAPAHGNVLCHARGFVGALPLHHAMGGRGLSGQHPRFAGELMARGAYAFVMREGDAAAILSRSRIVGQRGSHGRKRALIDSGRIANAMQVQAWARSMGWEAAVVALKTFPAAAQLAYYSQADLVLQAEGGSAAWALLVPPQIVGELSAHGRGSPHRKCPSPFYSSFVRVNAHEGVAGALQASAGFVHLFYEVTDTSRERNVFCGAAGAARGCAVRLPYHAAAGLLRTLPDLVSAGKITIASRTDLFIGIGDASLSAPGTFFTDKWKMMAKYGCGAKSARK
eukprot:Rhum_TRINITY_DN18689_c0_g1::Rhum_TRINITY_DN18689_c0_g1_i1::g.168100::m.168100